jgi:ketosteroid isomerase-like protein
VPFVLLALACQAPADTQPAGLAEADRTAITEAVSTSLALANTQPVDYAAYMSAYYAPDAMMMPPNGPIVQGRDAIATFMQSFGTLTSLSFEVQELEGAGDMAWSRGAYTLMFRPPGDTVTITDRGKYLEIWKKQSDGSWRVTRDIFNSDMPAEPPATTTAH